MAMWGLIDNGLSQENTDLGERSICGSTAREKAPPATLGPPPAWQVLHRLPATHTAIGAGDNWCLSHWLSCRS